MKGVARDCRAFFLPPFAGEGRDGGAATALGAARRSLSRLLVVSLLGLAACQPSEPSADARPPSEPASLHAHAEPKPKFDYWVLALSWSPEYCASREARPNSRQCSEPREFIVHGLWPQFERGYPEFCDTQTRVAESTADRLGELVPDRGLVFHQWKKHGSCSGMNVETYFATLERAGQSVVVPSAALQAASKRRVKRVDLEHAFIETNPGLTAEAISFTCSKQHLREVRICLDLQLKPRACGVDVDEACGRELNVRPSRS